MTLRHLATLSPMFLALFVPALPMGAQSMAPLQIRGAVTTIAGVAPGCANGYGGEARFFWPAGIASDGTNLFVAEFWNHTVRKVVIATGEVSTLAGSPEQAGSVDGRGNAARFSHPRAIATDGSFVYVADTANGLIRRIDPATGDVSTLAGGQGPGRNADDDGIGRGARFNTPAGIAVDGPFLYVADGHRIRRIVISTAEVSTIAGSKQEGNRDGTGSDARFSWPAGIACDGAILYVADTWNHLVRKVVIATGEVTTLPGTYLHPRAVALGGPYLYVANTEWSTITKIDLAAGSVSTLAGTHGSIDHKDGRGAAAHLNNPWGVVYVGTTLFVADTQNNTLRTIDTVTADVSTIAGSPTVGTTDGIGTSARFNGLGGIVAVGGNLYVSDFQNHAIRKVVIATGAVSLFAGKAGVAGSTDGTATAARFHWPRGLATDGSSLFVADGRNNTVRRISLSTGTVTTLAGAAGRRGLTDGTGPDARFDTPTGIACDGKNLYVTDEQNHVVRRIVISSGAVTTLAGSPASPGSDDGRGRAARFKWPGGIASDGINLYVADPGNNTIRRIVIATGEVTTLAGRAGSQGSEDGAGSAARFGFASPGGLFTDGTSLFVADTRNSLLRKVTIATGEVTALAGRAAVPNVQGPGFDDGIGEAARFYMPGGITSDGISLFVADAGSTIRKVE